MGILHLICWANAILVSAVAGPFYNTRTHMCGVVCVCVSSCCLVAQSCLTTLRNPMDYSLCQAALSMGFPMQQYWRGFPFPSSGIFSTQGLNLHLSTDRQILYCWATRKALIENIYVFIFFFRFFFPLEVIKSTEYSSLWSKAGPCCLFILYIVVCIC